jgi:hypothetical protein
VLLGGWCSLGCGHDEPLLEPCAFAEPSCVTACDARGLEQRRELRADPRPEGLRVALALLLPHAASPTTVLEAEPFLGEVLAATRGALSVCQLGVSLERSEVWSAPPASLDLTVTRPSSWAGLSPAGEPDPDGFNHAQGDRLPDELAALLGTVRGDLDAGVVLVVVAREVAYFTNGTRKTAGGASLPPVIFHHPDDFPLRNAVFAATTRPGCDALPVPPTPRLIAHELGHMLLDTGTHDSDPDNLMHDLRGPSLRPEQCARMRENVHRLFGPAPLLDPGPGG